MTARKPRDTKDPPMATMAAVEAEFDQAARPPHRFWTLVEGRAFFELGAFYMSRPFLSTLPKGDGHAVQVLPGFMASNTSTSPMRRLALSSASGTRVMRASVSAAPARAGRRVQP